MSPLNFEERAKILRRQRIVSIVVVIIFIVVIPVILTRRCMSEVEECGGVARCLGEFVRDFDEARKGE